MINFLRGTALGIVLGTFTTMVIMFLDFLLQAPIPYPYPVIWLCFSIGAIMGACCALKLEEDQ